MNLEELRQLSFQSLVNLATEDGINASGKDEIYGCIFGRDSAITVLKILKAYSRASEPVKSNFTPLLEISKRTLLTLVSLQGQTVNIESGEQPGKFIHEFRKDKFQHLIQAPNNWFVYPDGFMRNYDSIDSTPLAMIAIYKYWQATKDNEFLMHVLNSTEIGLNWILTYGDIDKDGLIEYEIAKGRTHGGLNVHSWTDSSESLLTQEGRMPDYPIAPVEAQGYAWLALKLWSGFYSQQSPTFSKKLDAYADNLKEAYNRMFTFRDKDLNFAVQALDGHKNQIKVVTANPILNLWAALDHDGVKECIVDQMFISDYVKRITLPDMYVKRAGIRTMSSLSSTFNPNRDSYHNGSFWTMLNGLIIEGLENFNYIDLALKLKADSLAPIDYFGFPLELHNLSGEDYVEYQSPSGQIGCREQAWSAASILDMTV